MAIALVKDSVAAPAHAAFEDRLLVAVCIETGSGAAINGTVGSVLGDIAAPAYCPDGGAYGSAQAGAFGGASRDRDFLRIGFTFLPILCQGIRIHALGIDYRIRVGGAAGS